VSLILAFSNHQGVRLAEVGFLLILIAGIWIAVTRIPRFKIGAARAVVTGLLLAIAGLFLLIATHWGHFGSVKAPRKKAAEAIVVRADRS
jgi:hypothetical protein